jgi:acyl-[acyl-carrier-protein] desaturase
MSHTAAECHSVPTLPRADDEDPSLIDRGPSSFLLSRGYRERLVARASHSLYRWYFHQSQQKRNWNPDRSFDWRFIRHDHSTELMAVIE